MRSLLLGLFLCISAIGVAQQEVPLNLPLMENKPYQFGFSIGPVFSNLQLLHSGAVTPSGTILLGDPTAYGMGMHVNVLATRKLSKHLYLRTAPGVTLVKTGIQFVEFSGDRYDPIATPEVLVSATYIELPIHFKYTAFRYRNSAPYLIAGINLRDNAAAFAGNLVALNQLDWCLEFGVGNDFYLPYFRFGLEAKLSLSMVNTMKNDRSDLDPSELYYTRALDKAFSRILVISLNFE